MPIDFLPESASGRKSGRLQKRKNKKTGYFSLSPTALMDVFRVTENVTWSQLPPNSIGKCFLVTDVVPPALRIIVTSALAGLLFLPHPFVYLLALPTVMWSIFCIKYFCWKYLEWFILSWPDSDTEHSPYSGILCGWFPRWQASQRPPYDFQVIWGSLQTSGPRLLCLWVLSVLRWHEVMEA